MKNAVLDNNVDSHPIYHCTSEGLWQVPTGGQCVCKPGFTANDMNISCSPCKPGTFKYVLYSVVLDNNIYLKD